jgi:hypothetical protein
MSRKSTSARIVTLLVVGVWLALTSCTGKATPGISSAGARTPGTVTVDILYLNHPPVLPVLANVDRLLTMYGDRVIVTRHVFGTNEGDAFAKKKKISGHLPVVILINDSPIAIVAGRKVTFESFPKGEGTGMIPDGEWSMTDLDGALKAATTK